ncbi:MAG: signal peptide peptidase SppA [Bacteroidota bacterium]
MMQFIKYFFASFLALALFSIVFILVLVGIASVGSGVKTIEKNSVLSLNLDKNISEQSHENPLASLGLPVGGGKEALGLNDIKDAIKSAKSNVNIRGIYLKVGGGKMGFATLKEIRNQLVDFKSSGKFIVAYAESYSEGAYYLSSVANEIYLSPEGLLEFNGIGSSTMYFKGLFDKLEVKPEIFKVGKYKSAIEPFITDKMSDANHEQLGILLNDIYGSMLNDISLSRQIPVNKLKLISDSMQVHNSSDALRLKLITHLAYPDQLEASLKKRLGIHEVTKKIPFVSIEEINEQLNTETEPENKIAVVVASGEIKGGNGNDEDAIYAPKLIAELKKAVDDASVKAIVLRINSPGGSALASDLMWREIEILKKRKPIVASMGDYAASGGYYMAMPCNKIVAQPTTITGSVGVFGLMFGFQDFLKNKIGVTVDGHYTGKFTDVGSMLRPLTEYEKKTIQTEVERIYHIFVTKAAQGRKLKYEQMHEYAQGRVWTGTQAKKIGLVDEIGGVETAVKLAAKLSKVDKYKVKYFPESKSFIENVTQNLSGSENESKIIATELGELYPYFRTLQQINNHRGIEAYLPYEFNW